jgi:hypothetical protein
MATVFKRGDHVEWNSEAGLVRGTIQKKVPSEITFNGTSPTRSRINAPAT